MSNWLSVYTDELDVLKNIVRSGDNGAAERAVERYRQKAGTHAKDATIEAIRRIVAGSYKSGNQPDGHTLIYAFEHLCRSYSRQAETVEIQVDQDTLPEIYDFVWKSKSDPFGLPVSQNGSPACAHWSNQQVKKFLALFRGLDAEEMKIRTDSDYGVEIGALCKVLKAASDNGQGVFVFFNE